MKKYLLILLLISCEELFAQIPEDALQYSWLTQNGSARSMAIGGAMASLGGDITAAFINPAGIGFYKNSECVITPGLILQNNSIGYRTTGSTGKNNAANFGPSGFIFGSVNRYLPERSNAICVAISQTANFNQHIRYSGLNNFSSYSEQFAEEFSKSSLSINDVLTNNSPLPYTAAPALFTYLIDTVRINGQLQVKAAPEYILDAGNAIRQKMDKTTRGGVYELAFTYASNLKDKWLGGITIGIPIVNFHSRTVFTETDTSSNTNNRFSSFTFTDDYRTTGAGMNARLGLIFRPKEYFRVGVAIHTPTFNGLTDTRTTTLKTVLENPPNEFNSGSDVFTGNRPGQGSYFHNTPWKFIVSGSYVFRETENIKQQRGFITADIEYVNHRNTRFFSSSEIPDNTEKAYYNALNKIIKARYRESFNFKIGGEIKYNVFMGRVGFAYYTNPYREIALKANQLLLSGGLGYRDKGFFADLTYQHKFLRYAELPYRLEDRANTFAAIRQQQGTFILTVGIKL